MVRSPVEPGGCEEEQEVALNQQTNVFWWSSWFLTLHLILFSVNVRAPLLDSNKYGLFICNDSMIQIYPLYLYKVDPL
jgi:hypothetical protein